MNALVFFLRPRVYLGRRHIKESLSIRRATITGFLLPPPPVAEGRPTVFDPRFSSFARLLAGSIVLQVVVWRSDNALVSINEVDLR